MAIRSRTVVDMKVNRSMVKEDPTNRRLCQAALVLTGVPRGQKQITLIREESVTSCLVESPDQAQRCIYDKGFIINNTGLFFKISDDVLHTK